MIRGYKENLNKNILLYKNLSKKLKFLKNLYPFVYINKDRTEK